MAPSLPGDAPATWSLVAPHSLVFEAATWRTLFRPSMLLTRLASSAGLAGPWPPEVESSFAALPFPGPAAFFGAIAARRKQRKQRIFGRRKEEDASDFSAG